VINRGLLLAPALPIDQGETTWGRRKKVAPHSWHRKSYQRQASGAAGSWSGA